MNPKSRPDLQSYGGRALTTILNRYHSERTDPLMPWVAREVKKGRLFLPEPVVRHDGEWGPQPGYKRTMFDEIAADPERGPEAADHAFDVWTRLPQNHDLLVPYDHAGETRLAPIAEHALAHIADWYHDENHPLRRGQDIMQLSWSEARELADEYHEDLKNRERAENMRKGDVIHSWPDGWTLQDLKDEEALKAEGDAMGHCVGGYGHEVDSGRTKILSLRDPNNQPHVTMELEPRNYALHEQYAGAKGPQWGNNEHPGRIPVYDESRPVVPGSRIVQIQGKGNEVPKDEYQQRLKEWFTAFPEEDRPNWEYDESPISHIGALEPEAEYQDYQGRWVQGEPQADADYWGDQDMGGYGPHGDYGLVKPHRAIDYGETIGSLARPKSNGTEDHYPHEVTTLYHEALRRGELPQFAKAVEQYGFKAQEQLDDDLEYQYDRPDDPGEDFDEDMMREWYESAHYDPVEYHHEDPEAQEAALRAYHQEMLQHYQDWREEQVRYHAPTQLANSLYAKINPHYDQAKGAFTNELHGDLAGFTPNHEQTPVRALPPGTEIAYNRIGWGTPELVKRRVGDPNGPSDHFMPDYIRYPEQSAVQPTPPAQQTFSSASHEHPHRYLWTFSPRTGDVHIGHEWDGHPAHVTTHEDLAQRLGESNLYHGYAYPIDGGYRIFNYDLDSVGDPFITRKVVQALAREFGPKLSMALLPEHLQEYVNQHGPYLEHWTRPENIPGILQHGIKPATHPLTDPTEEEMGYWDEEYQPPQEGDVRRSWDGFLETRNGYAYLAKPGLIGGQVNRNSLGENPYQVPVRVDIRKLDPKNLEADEDAARTLWPQWKERELQRIRDEEGREPEYYEPDWMHDPPEAGMWDAESGYGLGQWADEMQVGDPEWTRDSLMDEGTVAHYGTVPPEAISLHPDYMHAYPPEVHPGKASAVWEELVQ